MNRTEEQERNAGTIYRMYRSKMHLLILLSGFVLGLTLALYGTPPAITIMGWVNAGICGLSALITIGIRIGYRMNPYCGQCGQDKVDCMLEKGSLKPHH